MTSRFESRYTAIQGRDRRFDGQFFTGVKTTGIYCRPSCPARTPRPENVEFYASAAAAQAAGFRACRRCRPELAPGSPRWNQRTDVVGRALRLIAEGHVDEHGVAGLARTLAMSERHLNRVLTDDVGASALAIARMRRAQTARILLSETDLPITDIAFAAGYSSIRQFNDSIKDAFGRTPTELRPSARSDTARAGSLAQIGPAGADIVLRLPLRPPYQAEPLFRFFHDRRVDGIETATVTEYSRSLRLPRAAGTVELEPAPDHVLARLRLGDLRDLSAGVDRCRRMMDLDADPAEIAAPFLADPAMSGLWRRLPGIRIPGHPDGLELAVRAVVGQQISVAAARTILGRIVERSGTDLDQSSPPGTPASAVAADAPRLPTRLFPTATQLAEADLDGLGLTSTRTRTLQVLATAVAAGELDLGPGADRATTRAGLLALPGIGPWTTEYVAMRALADPDAFPAGDLVLRRRAAELGLPEGRGLAAHAEQWRPWRSYAAMLLWSHDTEVPETEAI